MSLTRGSHAPVAFVMWANAVWLAGLTSFASACGALHMTAADFDAGVP